MFPGRLLSTRVFYFGCAMPRASAYEDRAKNLPLQSAPILVSWRQAFCTRGNTTKQACTDPHPWFSLKRTTIFYTTCPLVVAQVPPSAGGGGPPEQRGTAPRATRRPPDQCGTGPHPGTLLILYGRFQRQCSTKGASAGSFRPCFRPWVGVPPSAGHHPPWTVVPAHKSPLLPPAFAGGSAKGHSLGRRPCGVLC